MAFKKAPLIERITFDLKSDKKQELSQWILTEKSAIENDRQAWFERQQKFLQHYDDFVNVTRKGLWQEAANLTLPFTAIMVKSYHARLYNLFTQDDILSIVPRENTDDDTAELYRRLYKWYIHDYLNEFRGITGLIDEIFLDVASVGFAVVMKDWQIKQRKTIQTNEISEEELAREMQEATEEQAEQEKISVAKFREIQKVITVFEGTRLRTIPYENVYFPNYIPESSNLNFPRMVSVVTEMTESELNLKVQQGLYDEASVAEVIESEGSTQYQNSDTHRAKEGKGNLSGYNEISTNTRLKKYDIHNAFCTYDIDEDGIDEELVVSMSAKGNVLQIVPLDRISKSGRRPLFKFDCFTKPRQAYSRSVPEMVYTLQKEMDMNHNMRMNYLQLQAMPFGTYRSSSGLKDEPIIISPGKFIPVEDTNDLKVVSFNVSAQALMGEENLLWNYGQQLVNVSPMSHGMVPEQVGPTRSTSGVLTLLGQLEKEFRPIANRNAMSFREMMISTIEDIDYKLPKEIKTRVIGPEADRLNVLLSDKRIDSEYDGMKTGHLVDLKIDVATIMNSEEMRRNQAYQIFSLLATPSALHQFGIVTPKNLHNAYIKWLKTFDYLNPQDYSSMPIGLDNPLTLSQEIAFVFQGLVPPMAMNDDHDKKAKGLLQFSQSPEYINARQLGRTVDHVDDVLLKTIEKHQQLAQALKPKGLPNPTGESGISLDSYLTGTSPQQGGNSAATTSRQDQASATSSEPESPVQSEGMG